MHTFLLLDAYNSKILDGSTGGCQRAEVGMYLPFSHFCPTLPPCGGGLKKGSLWLCAETTRLTMPCSPLSLYIELGIFDEFQNRPAGGRSQVSSIFHSCEEQPTTGERTKISCMLGTGDGTCAHGNLQTHGAAHEPDYSSPVWMQEVREFAPCSLVIRAGIWIHTQLRLLLNLLILSTTHLLESSQHFEFFCFKLWCWENGMKNSA